ncbi:hypothetical protein [Sphingomonas flavalba]|uniref:hypothetical protein n=1 Tax=Sphingomonas flavalba TaxID=2559804 RepID=UPI001EEFD26F|nr:hypothetical protein [Sphingomonas flavalba]
MRISTHLALAALAASGLTVTVAPAAAQSRGAQEGEARRGDIRPRGSLYEVYRARRGNPDNARRPDGRGDPDAAYPMPERRNPYEAMRARRGDQYEAYRARVHGQVRSLREIEGRIVPRMPGSTYIGPEFDSASGNYRLKFLRGGQVIWVDVDGRTGQVRGRSGY